MKKEFTEFSVLCWLDLRVAWFYSLAIIKRKSHRSDYTNACLCCAVVACLSPISHFIIPLLCWVSEGCTLPPCASVPGVPGQLAPSWLGPWEALVRDQRWEERSYKIFLSSSLATPLGRGWVLSLIAAPGRQVRCVSRVLWVPHALALGTLLLSTPIPPARSSSSLLLLRIS